MTSPSTIIERLRALVGPAGLLHSPGELLVYECDGYTIEKNRPDVVVFPTSTEQVAAVVKACNEANVPLLPRGAGTSLAGGALPEGETLTRHFALDDVATAFAELEAGRRDVLKLVVAP